MAWKRTMNNTNTVEVPCGACGSRFRVYKYKYNERIKKYPETQFFCCPEHLKQAKSKIMSKAKLDYSRRVGSRVTIECFTCKKIFERTKSRLESVWWKSHGGNTNTFCSNKCCVKYMALVNKTKPAPDPFDKWLANVSIPEDESQCWIWRGALRPFTSEWYTRNGQYGVFHWPRLRTVGAHVASYMLFYGDHDVAGYEICHKCDNPVCVNPEHLFKGTGVDNQLDALIKGRRWSGAKHHKALFTEKEVIVIRARAFAGETRRSIAKDLGVDPATIGRIVSKKTYYHLYDSEHNLAS